MGGACRQRKRQKTCLLFFTARNRRWENWRARERRLVVARSRARLSAVRDTAKTQRLAISRSASPSPRLARTRAPRTPARSLLAPRGIRRAVGPAPPLPPPPRGRVRAPLSRAAAIRPVTGASFQRAPSSSSSSSSSGPSRPLLPRGRHPTAVRAFSAPRGAPLRPWRRSPRTPSRSRCRTRRWGRG